MTTPRRGQRHIAALEARRFDAARLFTQGKPQAVVVMRRPPAALLPANVSAQFNSALSVSADPTVIRGPATIAQIPRA
jgi:hypothetical protein